MILYHPLFFHTNTLILSAQREYSINQRSKAEDRPGHNASIKSIAENKWKTTIPPMHQLLFQKCVLRLQNVDDVHDQPEPTSY